MTITFDFVQKGKLVGEDVVDGALAGDVLNLTAREVEVRGS